MAGARPKPTIIKIAEGNPGRRPLNQNEPHPKVADLSEPPGYFGKSQKEIWRRYVAGCPAGLITVVDVGLLEAYCLAYALMRKAGAMVEKEGETVTAPSGYVQASPWVSMGRQARAEVKQLSAELGFSPSSRSKVTLTEPGGKGEQEKKEAAIFGD